MSQIKLCILVDCCLHQISLFEKILLELLGNPSHCFTCVSGHANVTGFS